MIMFLDGERFRLVVIQPLKIEGGAISVVCKFFPDRFVRCRFVSPNLASLEWVSDATKASAEDSRTL
jgi:hypothetical protein